MNNTGSSVLLIYTGGTIGMKEDPETQTLRPFDFGSLMDEVPELKKFAMRIDSYTFDPLIDSSDIEPAMWKKLAEIISRNYKHYDGFVVLHGTDTMAYSASALSFMLENLGKSVIFTGSQLPVGRLRTDGKENLISAIEIAGAKTIDGKPMVPEVCVFFNSLLLRGNRCTKVDAEGFDAFRSPNLAPLAEAGIEIRYNTDLIRRQVNGVFRAHYGLDTRVSILKVHPGITSQVVEDILLGPLTRAVIIETYGCGNAPSKDWFLEIVRESVRRGKILLDVTQCLRGQVNMERYATGRALKDAGVLSGGDITTESALAKLFFLMGNTDDNEYVKECLEADLRGEMSN
ncbi:MAG: type I asparaginase [Bacteroidales bacterium]|nr:type I asparaginase [Bacteroidales bacterium]